LKDERRLQLAHGFVVWDDDHGVLAATNEGAFVWDKNEDALAHCREDRNERPRRVEVVICD